MVEEKIRCMGVSGEALQLCAVLKSCIFTTSHTRIRISTTCENSYQVLQVTHAVSECAMKSKVHLIKSLSP